MYLTGKDRIVSKLFVKAFRNQNNEANSTQTRNTEKLGFHRDRKICLTKRKVDLVLFNGADLAQPNVPIR